MIGFEESIVQKIKANALFSKSPIYSKLLDYLFDCFKKQKIPTEYDIAQNVFGKGKEFDPSVDSTVRVYISKLRKKLENYYENDAKHDKIRLTIPKRHYKLEFIHEAERKSQKKINTLLLVILPLLVLLTGAVIFLATENRLLKNKISADTKTYQHNFVWGDILTNGFPTILSFGQLYTFGEYDSITDTYRIIRDYYINSDKDLKTYRNLFPVDRRYIKIPEWRIVPESALRNLSKLLPVFVKTNEPLRIKLSSQIQWNDVARSNIIYVGHFHNLNILKKVFPTDHFYSPSLNTNYAEFKNILEANTQPLKPHLHSIITSSERVVLSEFRKLFVTFADRDTTYQTIYMPATKQARDYVVISKVPGPNGNVLLFIISFDQIGREKIINTLTSPERSEEFKTTILKMTNLPRYFEMLVEVEGFEGTALKMNLKHFFRLSDQFKIYQ